MLETGGRRIGREVCRRGAAFLVGQCPAARQGYRELLVVVECQGKRDHGIRKKVNNLTQTRFKERKTDDELAGPAETDGGLGLIF